MAENYNLLNTFLVIIQNYWRETRTVIKFLALKNFLQNNHYKILILMLIVLAMDVERNPGPLSESIVFNWNARSIRHKLDYLKDLADEFSILCLTETHLDENIHTEEILLDHFSSPFRKDRHFAGGGILIYCSDQLFCKRRLDIESPTEETIWIEIKLNSMVLMLCVAY